MPRMYALLTKNKKIFILLTLVTTQLLYSMYVGGDAWEFFGGANRYVAIAIPLFFIALACTFNHLRLLAKKLYPKQFSQYKLAEAFCLIVLFLVLNTGSDNMLLYLTQVKIMPTVGENENQTRVAKSLGEITIPGMSIGIVMAGVTPYFLPDRRFVDLLGKSDKVIAYQTYHQDPNTKGLKKYLNYLPGHGKWDYIYVVNHVKPDVFGQIWPESEIKIVEKRYKKVLFKEGYPFYIKKKK
jgi:hypothetical protein